MESFDLTYKLIALNIKSKTLDQIYFMSQVFQNIVIVMTKGKNKKIKTTKLYLFLLPPLPSQDGGGGCCIAAPPHPPTFFMGKIFEKNFHRYMSIWTKGG